MNRRRFLQQTSCSAAGIALGGAGFANLRAAEPAKVGETKPKASPMQPIVDTHVHLWDLSKFKLPWLKPEMPFNRSFLVADYLSATAGLNVAKGVYMEVDVEPSQQPAEAQFVIDLCQSGKSPVVAGVISGRPASPGFAKYIRAYKDSPYIKGVRQVLHNPGTPRGFCLEPAFIAGVRLLGQLRMRFDLCLRADELLDGAKLIDACPDTRFVLDHCGNADVQAKDRSVWQRDIEALAKRRNVVGKISGIVAGAPKGWTPDDLAPVVNHTLDVFGPDRVMFAGDWPVCTMAATYRQWVEALKTIVANRSAEQRQKLFHDNAVRFYELTS
jgi:L-fuconolactonase